MKGRTISNIEVLAIRALKPGDVFYSIKSNAIITAIAFNNGKKVKTERMIAIDSAKCSRIEKITKVTLL